MDDKFNDLTRMHQEIYPRLKKAERFREAKGFAFPFLVLGALTTSGGFAVGFAFAAAAHGVALLMSELELFRLKVQLDSIELQRSLHDNDH